MTLFVISKNRVNAVACTGTYTYQSASSCNCDAYYNGECTKCSANTTTVRNSCDDQGGWCGGPAGGNQCYLQSGDCVLDYDNAIVECGEDGDDGGSGCSSCTKEPVCTPVCPGGWQATPNGLPAGPNASCNYGNGKCGGLHCDYDTKTIPCYPVDPLPTVYAALLTTSGTSPKQCNVVTPNVNGSSYSSAYVLTRFMDTSGVADIVDVANWFRLDPNTANPAINKETDVYPMWETPDSVALVGTNVVIKGTYIATIGSTARVRTNVNGTIVNRGDYTVTKDTAGVPRIVVPKADIPDILQSTLYIQVRQLTPALPPAQVLSNNSWGIRVSEDAAGVWTNIYLAIGYHGATSYNYWVKIGTVGTGKRATIHGQNGKILAYLYDVRVRQMNSSIYLDYNLYFTDPAVDSTLYESPSQGRTNLWAGGMDADRTKAIKFVQTNKYFIFDRTLPTIDSINPAFSGTSTLSLGWTVSDALSGLYRTNGDGFIASPGIVNSPINDTTSGITNYTLGSGSNVFDGIHLWTVNTPINTLNRTRTDWIALGTNMGGSLGFTVDVFDRACNNATQTVTVPLSGATGTTWMATKGGLVYSQGSSNVTIPTFASHQAFSTDAYWLSPYGFYQDEVDLTSEVFSSYSATLSQLKKVAMLGSGVLAGTYDSNNKANYWFDELNRRLSLMIAKRPTTFDSKTLTAGGTLSGNLGAISIGGSACTAGKTCVIKSSGDINISSLVCNIKAVIVAGGNITVSPDVTNANGASNCVYLAKGDITIGAGTYKSTASTYPKYDIVEGVFIADNKIVIPLADQTQSMPDGLKINGSIIGFGSNAATAIDITRNLGPVNSATFPAVAVHGDNRYNSFLATLFGGSYEGYKKETGFKPL